MNNGLYKHPVLAKNQSRSYLSYPVAVSINNSLGDASIFPTVYEAALELNARNAIRFSLLGVTLNVFQCSVNQRRKSFTWHHRGHIIIQKSTALLVTRSVQALITSLGTMSYVI